MKTLLFASALMLAGLGPAAQAAPVETAAKTDTAAAGVPSAADVLFEQPQMRNTRPGSTIRYAYTRRSGISRGPYGPPIDDEIKLSIAPGKESDNRDIQVQMFSGGNRAPAGPFTDMPVNPIVPLFLENHLKGVAGLLGANPRYIKNAIRKGLREGASVTPTRVEFEGRQVDGWRIVAKPFVGDPQAGRMRGLDSLTYTFVTSPEVPGEIVLIEAQARQPDGGELLDEKVRYDNTAG